MKLTPHPNIVYSIMSILSLVLAVVTGAVCVLFAVFAVLNIFARCGVFGRFGAKFHYEMDVVMGGLVGIPFYSFFEGVILAGSVILAGHPLVASGNAHAQLHGALGMLALAAYNVVCVFYAVFAGQPIGPFAVIAALLGVLLAWRIGAYVPLSDEYNVRALAIAGAVAVVLVAVFALRMKARMSEREPVNERFRRIQVYCERNPAWDWVVGKSGPLGFEG